MTEAPTRGEFELLRQIVVANQNRLEAIDDHGTRGVGVVQAQLVEVVKDLAELKADVNKRFDAQTNGRRWQASTTIAALVLLVAILGLLLNLHPLRLT